MEVQIKEREIGEVEVQEALVRLLDDSAAIRKRLLSLAMDGRDLAPSTLRYAGAKRSVVEGRSETDILAEWTRGSGQRVLIFIEVKLLANFMKRQGARYKERVAGAVERGDATHALSVLVAPEKYFAGANTEVRQFDALLALEEIVELAEKAESRERGLIVETLGRIASGRPLGAKGLHRGIHDALAAEFSRRDSPLRITNNATDWVFVDHPALDKGLRARYRISEGVVELRVNKSYGLPHTSLPKPTGGLRQVSKNTETHFKLPPLSVTPGARKDSPSEPDVRAIADAMEGLVRWWVESRPSA